MSKLSHREPGMPNKLNKTIPRELDTGEVFART
jgi:hypothetical protein